MADDSELKYDANLEKLLKEQAEVAESLSILHRNAHRKYSRYTNLINIPVIIGSSAVGFTTGLDLSKVDNMNIILGIVSVFIGIIKSLDSYFQLGRISETHRMVSLAYSQINKKIAVELALNRKDRITPKDMLSIIKTDIKNLEDISPLVPEDIIDDYKKEFGDKYENIKKPNITNGLSPIEINTSGENSRKNSMAVSADIVPLSGVNIGGSGRTTPLGRRDINIPFPVVNHVGINEVNVDVDEEMGEAM